MTALFPGGADLSTTLAWTIVTFLWQATLVGALAWGTLTLCARLRPTTRYALSLLLLGSVIVLPLATLVQFRHDAGGEQTGGGGSAPLVSTKPDQPVAVVSSAILSQPDDLDLTEPAQRPSVIGSAFNLLVDRWSALQTRLLEGIVPMSGLIVVAWLLGVGLFAGRLVLDLLVIRALRRAPVFPLPAGLASRAEALRRRVGLGASVRIAASNSVGMPLVLGVVKPLALLPNSILATMPQDDVEMLIAHELAHIKRFDYAINLGQAVVESLLFFHPLTWWLSNRVRTEREHCCDERALKTTATTGSIQRVRYIAALLAAEEARSVPGPRLAPSSSRRSLLRRAEELLERKGHQRADALVYATASAFGLTLLALIALPQPSLAALRTRAQPATPMLSSPIPAVVMNEERVGARQRVVWLGVVSPGAWLRVRNLVGGVRVERTSGAEVEVRAIGQPQSSRLSFRTTREASGVTICAIRPGVECDENGNVSRVGPGELLGDSATLIVRLPDGINLLVASNDGALQIAGRPLAVQAQTGKGAISIRGARGSVEAATGGGEVRVEDVAGGVVVRSGGGDVTLLTVSGDAEVRTSNGDIDAFLVTTAGVRSWSLQTGSGAIRVQGQSLGGVKIEADAPNGNIESDFPYVRRSGSSHAAGSGRESGQSFLFASTSSGNVTISATR